MWLHVPGIASNCAPGSAGSGSASTSPNLQAAASLTWRGKHLQQPAWSRAWKRATWLRRLSGLTLPPSTLEHGAERWIASCQATRASRTASPASAAAPTTTASSSSRLSACSTKAGLIVCSARTSRGTPTGSSPPSSRFWSDWVAALRSESSARAMSAQATGGSGCSSWPTVRTSDTNGAGEHGDGGPDLRTVAAAWPTPRAEDSESCGRRHGRDVSDTLTAATRDFAVSWPTPRANDPEKRGDFDATDPRTGLPGAAVLWGTPCADDTSTRSKRCKQGGTLLSMQVDQWPTPAASEARQGYQRRPSGMASEQGQQSLSTITADFQPSLQVQPIPDGPQSSPPRRSLNPLFVEWLMGWPPGWTGGWTDCAPAATASCHWWRLMRGALSTLCSPKAPEQGTLL
jgi:hypothetical protein